MAVSVRISSWHLRAIRLLRSRSGSQFSAQRVSVQRLLIESTLNPQSPTDTEWRHVAATLFEVRRLRPGYAKSSRVGPPHATMPSPRRCPHDSTLSEAPPALGSAIEQPEWWDGVTAEDVAQDRDCGDM